MSTVLLVTSGLALLSVIVLKLWRLSDDAADNRTRAELIAVSGKVFDTFSMSLVEDLPEPAQRYFRYMIDEGTPVTTTVEIEMTGELGLGTKSDPKYQPMTAFQVLAPPHGLIWQLKTRSVSGSDGLTPETSWTRFWLWGLLPIVRASGPDHFRSAFGRVVAEGAFWAPASLLPSEQVSWEELDRQSARAVVVNGTLSQNIDIFVRENGQPSRVVIQRWSNANSDKVFREQPFGGDLSDFRKVNGFCLPFRVEGGNLIGSKAYFPFYKAEVRSIRTPTL